MGGCVEWHTDLEELEGIGPPVPPRLARSTSQLAIRSSSEPIPPNLQRRNSDGNKGADPFSYESSSKFDFGPTVSAEIPSGSNHHFPVPDLSDRHSPVPKVDERKPVKLSSYIVDPTAAYEDNKPGWKSTLHTSAGLVIDIVKESSDAFTPLKSVAGGLSAILKHYDVRHLYSAKHCTPLTLGLASDSKPRINRIVNPTS
jgi:hypothetical protein